MHTDIFLLAQEHVRFIEPQTCSPVETALLEFLDGVINHPPAYPSYTTPAYSNIAYALLGFAYEAITGRTYDQGFLDIYHGKLDMTSSTPRYPGPDVDAIIPRNDSYAIFSYDIGNQGP